MKLKIISITTIFICFINCFNIVNAYAYVPIDDIYVIDCNEEYNSFKSIQLTDNIVINKKIMINNCSYELYPVFDNCENAINNLKKEIPDLIYNIKKNFCLTELSHDTIDEYYEYFLNRKYDVNSFDPQDIEKLSRFFDIYENYESNNEIIKCVYSSMEFEEKINRLVVLLPYNSSLKLKEEFNVTYNIDFSSYCIDDAIAYARTYAVNPNSNNYPVYSSDCTNFASQILENGGISQDYNYSTNQGWWHDYLWGEHETSVSWRVANKFANYMGVSSIKTSNLEFSRYIEPGDIVLIDIYADGDWNHAGFVVMVDNYMTNGYYDYLIAQHSDNYIAWASTSVNNWENQSRYGIIRNW